jgi:citrate synthase
MLGQSAGFLIERPKSVTTELVKLWLDGKGEIWGE